MLSSSSSLLHLHPNDNVLMAKTALALGQDIPELGVRTRAQVPAGHKIAARRIAEGEQVKKYDTVIGVATRDLEPGDYVHSHNLKLVDALQKLASTKGCSVAQVAIAWALAQGEDVVPLVGSRTRERLAEALDALDIVLTADDLATLDKAFPPGVAAGDRYNTQGMASLDSER